MPSMKFEDVEIPGCKIIYPEKNEDERGYFARTFCHNQFAEENLHTEWVQSNTSFNKKSGTTRGMHLQLHPFPEIKLIRCTRGSAYDVLLDARKSSKTFGKWVSVEISANNSISIYVPEGVAHGYQTLEDNTELSYLHSVPFKSELSTGFSIFDPSLSISWPLEVSVISQKDLNWQNFK